MTSSTPPPDGESPPPGGRALSRLVEVEGLSTVALSLGVAVICVELLYLLSAELGARLLGPGLPALDSRVELWLHSFQTPTLTALFLGLTFLGIAPVMALQTAAATSYLAATRRPLLAWALLLTMIGEVVLEYTTKTIVQRARPDLFRLAAATGYSFPSGHALASTCLYGFLAFVFWPRRGSLWHRAIVLSLGVGLPLGIGLSRVYVGVHFPTDVLGGWLGGAIWLCCGQYVLGRLARTTHLGVEEDQPPPDG